MKLTAKQKWGGIVLWFILSCVFTYFMCVNLWFGGIIIGYLLICASVIYCVVGLIHYKIFERFFAWLTKDDK